MQRRFELIHWTPKAMAGLGRNQVSPEEVEEVLVDPYCHLRVGRDGRLLLGGRTAAGRMLICVLSDEGFGSAGVVTARYMTDAEGRIYVG